MWLTLLPLLGPGLPSSAFAGSAKAELQQLDEDVRVLVNKNAWSGVERIYVQMAALEARGAKLTWEYHKWGALAAQSRGDVLATWHRLRAAEAVESHEETLVWLATLEATHGRAVVELSPLVFGEVALEPASPVVDPAAQKTIAQASASLTQTRTFDGLLPLGQYRVGNVGFGIDGGPMVRVRVEPGQARGKLATEPGTVRLVAGAVPARVGDLDRALDAARTAAEGTPGVASVEVVGLAGRRVYADFSPGSLEMLGLTPSLVAEQVRAALGARPTDVLPGPDSVAVSAQIGLERLKAVTLVFEGGEVTVGSVCRLGEAPDRTAPPPGLLLRLAPSVDPEVVRTAVLQRLGANELKLVSP
jgi:hypothetical protein